MVLGVSFPIIASMLNCCMCIIWICCGIMSCRDGFVTRMAEGERSVQMLACNKFSSSRALVPFKVPYFFSLILPLVLFKNYKPYLSLLPLRLEQMLLIVAVLINKLLMTMFWLLVKKCYTVTVICNIFVLVKRNERQKKALNIVALALFSVIYHFYLVPFWHLRILRFSNMPRLVTC